jgi:hypothetical protein
VSFRLKAFLVVALQDGHQDSVPDGEFLTASAPWGYGLFSIVTGITHQHRCFQSSTLT